MEEATEACGHVGKEKREVSFICVHRCRSSQKDWFKRIKPVCLIRQGGVGKGKEIRSTESLGATHARYQAECWISVL